MTHYTAKRMTILIFTTLVVILLLVPTFSRPASSISHQKGTIDIHNPLLKVYNKTSSELAGFGNITCESGHQYVLMTGQFTPPDTSYKVVFLRMILLDDSGHSIATGSGFVDDVEIHKTKAFNAITRYSASFSACIVQIDTAIPK